MRRLTMAEAEQLRRRMEQKRALGQYDESEIFRASPNGADAPFARSFEAPAAPAPQPYADPSGLVQSSPQPYADPSGLVQSSPSQAYGKPNYNAFAVYPFWQTNLQGTNGAVTIIPANLKRTLLLVQNQSSTADMFFNLSGDAGLNIGIRLEPGVGVFFDVVCPNNAVSVYVDSATPEPGCVVEGSMLV